MCLQSKFAIILAINPGATTSEKPRNIEEISTQGIWLTAAFWH